jgi:hypothetical protein
MTKIKIEPMFKKSVVDIEFFYNEETGVWIHYEQGWRWGTFYADVTDEEMKELRIHNAYVEETRRQEDFEISALTDYEMNDTWDGVWGDIRVYKSGWTDEQLTELKETVENSDYWWDWLIDNGFEPQESETYICGQISIELEGENENETTLPKETN